MKKVRWGVIGAGGIADRRTLPGMMLSEEAELVAVMEINDELAEKLRVKYGAKRAFTDHKALLADPEVDVVYIASPVFCHKEQALTALKYGVDVLVEKPVCMTTDEGKELLDAFKAAGRQLTVGYMMKHHSLHERAKAIIAEGVCPRIICESDGTMSDDALAMKQIWLNLLEE